MGYEIIKWARERALPAGPKSLLRVLADRADKDGKCWPGQETLAKELGRGVRSVRRWLDELECEGCIKRVHRYRKDRAGGRTSDVIILCFWDNRLPATAASKPASSNATEEGFRPNAAGLAANRVSLAANGGSLAATVAGESPEELPENLPKEPPERGAAHAGEEEETSDEEWADIIQRGSSERSSTEASAALSSGAVADTVPGTNVSSLLKTIEGMLAIGLDKTETLMGWLARLDGLLESEMTDDLHQSVVDLRRRIRSKMGHANEAAA